MFRIILLVLSAAGLLWALAVWLLGGFQIAIGGFEVASNDPFRPLLFALILAAAYAGVTGRSQLRRNLSNWRRISTSFALLLALCPAVAGLARNSWTAAGADSFASVSQADRWLHGALKIPVPLAEAAPWPDAVWSLTPNGYRPAVSGAAFVPVYPPGLPMMMAAAKLAAGHCAMFWVVPLTGALLVLVTFAMGRRLGSD